MVTKPKYFQEAERLLGIKEVAGKQANEEIVELFKESGNPGVISDEVPWCAAFVGGTLVRGNKGTTGLLTARSFADPKFSDKFEKLKKPELYCIGVMKRGKSSWEGHVGYVVDFDAKYVWMLGGNQSNAVNVSRFPRSAFVGSGLGFVKPKGDSIDVTIPELKKDSRALRTSGWYQKLLASLGLVGTVTWQTLSEVKAFASDNAGLLILGTLALGVFGMWMYDKFTIGAYKDGRYLPKAQE